MIKAEFIQALEAVLPGDSFAADMLGSDVRVTTSESGLVVELANGDAFRLTVERLSPAEEYELSAARRGVPR